MAYIAISQLAIAEKRRACYAVNHSRLVRNLRYYRVLEPVGLLSRVMAMIPIPDDFTGFITYYQDGYMIVVEVVEGVHTERSRTWIGEQDKTMCLSRKDGFQFMIAWRRGNCRWQEKT